MSETIIIELTRNNDSEYSQYTLDINGRLYTTNGSLGEVVGAFADYLHDKEEEEYRNEQEETE